MPRSARQPSIAVVGLSTDVYDHYRLSDIFGFCAGMCEEKGELHRAEDHILLEVFEQKTGEPVPEGKRGEQVLTALKKAARPMIRLRTGASKDHDLTGEYRLIVEHENHLDSFTLEIERSGIRG